MSEEKNLIKVTDTEETAEEALVVNAENVDEIVKSGKGILKLHNEIEVDGKKTDSIYFDFTSISGIQYRNIVRNVEKKNKKVIQGQPAGDIDVQAAVFAKASDIPVAVVESDLSMKDFALASTVTYAFLMA
jgi:hypothetical protein